ncbi:MAG: hypothetical protein ACP5OG_05120 [Candidatus Nanoarchaeia archaeon]
MSDSLHSLIEFMKIANEELAEFSQAYYDERGLRKIIELEKNKITDYSKYLDLLSKKGELKVYASSLIYKHMHDFAWKIPSELIV